MILQFLQDGNLTNLVITAIIMVFALIFHNIAQAWVASRYGDNTPRFQGYMNFDPQQHLEPMGVLFLFLLGFGWPKPIPANSRNYRGRGRQEALVWYAGPLAYLLVALVSVLAAAIFFNLQQGELGVAFSLAGRIAIRHAVINLFPVYPLDGARAALAWGNADVRRTVQTIASWGLLGFIGVFYLLSFTGILGRIESFFLGIIITIIRLIPGF